MPLPQNIGPRVRLPLRWAEEENILHEPQMSEKKKKKESSAWLNGNLKYSWVHSDEFDLTLKESESSLMRKKNQRWCQIRNRLDVMEESQIFNFCVNEEKKKKFEPKVF